MSRVYKKLIISLAVVCSFATFANEPETKNVETAPVISNYVETVEVEAVEVDQATEQQDEAFDLSEYNEAASGCMRHPYCGNP